MHLDHIHRQGAQQAQVGGACPEIAQRNLQPQPAQLVQGLHQFRRCIEQRLLADLDAERLRLKAVGQKALAQLFHHVGLLQFQLRDAHGQARHAHAHLLPGSQLLANRFAFPVAQHDDQAGLHGNGHKLMAWNTAQCLARPVHDDLRTGNLAGGQVGLQLVGKAQLTAFCGMPKA